MWDKIPDMKHDCNLLLHFSDDRTQPICLFSEILMVNSDWTQWWSLCPGYASAAKARSPGFLEISCCFHLTNPTLLVALMPIKTRSCVYTFI